MFAHATERNRIVPGCWSIDLDMITTASEHLPVMVDQLRALQSVLDRG